MIPAGGSDSQTRLVVAAEEWPRAAAQKIAEIIEQAVAQTGHAHIALAGGNTPRAVYAELARMPTLPWQRIDVYFGDERAAPPTDPQSNYRMAREALLDHVPIPAAQVHRMEAERTDLDAAADDYAAGLPDLDLIILGSGEDGHTASLFPGAPALNEHRRKVVAVDSPKPPPRRLTITPPVIAAARTVIMLVGGASKATAVARALEGADNVNDCPAQLARAGIWIMDRAAARLVSR